MSLRLGLYRKLEVLTVGYIDHTTMECSFALTGKGYVLIASDTNAARSIVKMKSDEDKSKVLSPHLVMTYSGEPGTCNYSLEILPGC